MSKRYSIQTVIGAKNLEYDGQFIIAFGTPPPTQVPQDRQLTLEQADEDALERALAIEPTAMYEGLLFLFPNECTGLDMAQVRLIQRRMIHHHYKHVEFPKRSLSTPDKFNVRQEHVPEIIRLISGLKNTPYTLRYPLAEKLELLNINKPVLVLMPGPSLNTIAPKLKELAKRCVVVCIARTLPWCLGQGIEPDFVVQLDTFLVQQHLYDNLPKLPNTILVPITIAPIHRYAHKFRGIFFIDSFNLGVLSNPYRLRESHVSSLMACMGLAECLHAPECYLVGTDLSTPDKNSHYFNTTSPAKPKPFDNDKPIIMLNESMELDDRNGNATFSMIRYLATAVEAEEFAQAIDETTGTTFFNLTAQGILSKRWFPAKTQDELLDLPVLDRSKIRSKIDKGLNNPEKLNLTRFKVFLMKLSKDIKKNLLFLTAAQQSGKLARVQDHPFFIFSKKVRDFTLPDNDTARLEFAISLGRQWLLAANQAQAWTRACIAMEQGGKVPMFCDRDETDDMTQRFSHLIPKESIRFLHIYTHLNVPANKDKKDIYYPDLYPLLSRLDAAFVSRSMVREYDYFFDTFPGENVIYFDPLFENAGQ